MKVKPLVVWAQEWAHLTPEGMRARRESLGTIGYAMNQSSTPPALAIPGEEEPTPVALHSHDPARAAVLQSSGLSASRRPNSSEGVKPRTGKLSPGAIRSLCGRRLGFQLLSEGLGSPPEKATREKSIFPFGVKKKTRRGPSQERPGGFPSLKVLCRAPRLQKDTLQSTGAPARRKAQHSNLEPDSPLSPLSP